MRYRMFAWPGVLDCQHCNRLSAPGAMFKMQLHEVQAVEDYFPLGVERGDDERSFRLSYGQSLGQNDPGDAVSHSYRCESCGGEATTAQTIVLDILSTSASADEVLRELARYLYVGEESER